MDDEDTMPIWARFLIAGHLWVIGAVLGGLWTGSFAGAVTGMMVAAPFAALIILAPGFFGVILQIFGLFSCAG